MWGLICSSVIEASLIVTPSVAVEAVLTWKLAVIVVLPLLSPLATTVALTLAIDSSALSQFTRLLTSSVAPLEYRAVAVNYSVVPTANCFVWGVIVSELSVTEGPPEELLPPPQAPSSAIKLNKKELKIVLL
jgi:hypothetical protein